LGATAAALIGSATACSSSTAPAAQSTVASSSTSTSAHDAFAQCLSDNGVPAPPDGGHGQGGPPPDGTPPSGPPPQSADGVNGAPPAPPGIDQSTWDKAMQACSSLAPAPPQK